MTFEKKCFSISKTSKIQFGTQHSLNLDGLPFPKAFFISTSFDTSGAKIGQLFTQKSVGKVPLWAKDIQTLIVLLRCRKKPCEQGYNIIWDFGAINCKILTNSRKKTTEKCYKYLLFTGKCKFVMCISSFFSFNSLTSAVYQRKQTKHI